MAGTPKDCADGLRAVVEAGADLILLHPVNGDPSLLERLAAEVSPAVTKDRPGA